MSQKNKKWYQKVVPEITEEQALENNDNETQYDKDELYLTKKIEGGKYWVFHIDRYGGLGWFIVNDYGFCIFKNDIEDEKNIIQDYLFDEMKRYIKDSDYNPDHIHMRSTGCIVHDGREFSVV